MSDVEISWYGERGIVNALVTALKRTGTSAVRSLLECIDWAAETPTSWIEDLKSVRIIVEVSLGQFGDPDLILVCKTTSNATYTVFIEAKTGSYQNCASSNKEGMSRPGFNSSINGQLSLKYRFATALAIWQGGEQPLEEPEALFDLYKRIPAEGGLRDLKNTPRRLNKPAVLKILRTANLASISLENCFFVAWTNDTEAFYSNNGVESDLKPLFLSESQEVIKPHLGWLGFNKIPKSAEFDNAPKQPYQLAVATMISEPNGDEETAIDIVNLTAVNGMNLEQECSDQTIRILEKLQKLAAESFDQRAVKPKDGSISIAPFKKVLLKLVPQNDEHNSQYIKLGVSTALNRQNWGDHQLAGPVCIGRQPFYTLDLPPDDMAKQIASEVFEEVAEMLGYHTAGEGD